MTGEGCMAITDKLRYTYEDLANEFMDKIPVTQVEDFPVICKILQLILQNNLQQDDVPNSMRVQVQSIRDILDNPDMYVEKDDYARFAEIIKSQIQERILWFDSEGFTFEKRLLYIQRQQEGKRQAQEYQAILAVAKPPEGEARTEDGNPLLATIRRQPEEVQNLQNQAHISLEHLLRAFSNDRYGLSEFLDSVEEVIRLVQAGITGEQLLGMDSGTRRDFIFFAEQIEELCCQAQVPASGLIPLDSEKRSEILAYSARVREITVQSHISFEKLAGLELSQLQTVLSNEPPEQALDILAMLQQDISHRH